MRKKMRKNRINMKKFIHKSFAFIIIFVILIVALDLLSAQNDDFSAYFGKLTNSSDYSRYAGVSVNPKLGQLLIEF